MAWQLHRAKNQLSEIVRLVRTDGPQIITVHGKDAAIILSPEEFRRMTGKKGDLVSFLRSSPFADAKLDLDRSQDTGRDMDL